MKILIVSENFVKGGLETHIKTIYDLLLDNNELFFAFGRYDSKIDLSKSKKFSNFNFSCNSSVDEFCSDVDRLVEIIKTNEIDIIMVHPFHSIFPAVFAANITKTKIILTCHGRSSLTFPNTPTEISLFEYMLYNQFNKIFSVSKSSMNALKKYDNIDVAYIPNLVNLENFKPHKSLSNKKWAIISRIDDDKINSIIQMLDYFNAVDINSVDIIGDGNSINILEKYIEDKKGNYEIKLLGYVADIPKQLEKGYTGVCGIGRVVAESLAMNYPTICYGYGKIIGVIDKNKYNLIKEENFIPESLESISLEEFKQQIDNINKGKNKKYYLSDNIIEDFSVSKWQTEILLQMDKCYSVNNFALDELYLKIKKLGKEKFYYSDSVFKCIYDMINKYTYNIDLKNNSSMLYMMSELNNKIESLEKSIGIVAETFEEASVNKQEKLQTLFENINKLENDNIQRLSDNIQKISDYINIIEDDSNKKTKNIYHQFNTFGLKRLINNDLAKIKSKVCKNSGNEEIICVMCLYNEELNIKDCINHLYKYVDKFVIFDDGSTDKTVSILKKYKKVVSIIENKNKKYWAERTNRETVLRKAFDIAETKRPWVLCMDADERLELRFLKNLRKIVSEYENTKSVLTVHFRELWDSHKKYRIDEIWDKKVKGLLFQLDSIMTFDYESEHHIPWAYKEINSNQILIDYNLYHLKMINKKDREDRKKLYKKLDPKNKMQPIGYDYLTDYANIELAEIKNVNKYDYKYVSKYYKKPEK